MDGGKGKVPLSPGLKGTELSATTTTAVREIWAGHRRTMAMIDLQSLRAKASRGKSFGLWRFSDASAYFPGNEKVRHPVVPLFV